MKTETITVFDQTYNAACKIRDAMNATLPPTGQIEVQHVLATATGMGIGTLCQAWEITEDGREAATR
jgi:hypothetical protein